MRGCTPALEQRFFAIFRDYYDLERSPVRRYAGTEYSLDRMRPLAALAGHPEHGLRLVHVAGTKGKGSTCHLLSAFLASRSLCCGMFTSPHLSSVRERFQVNNRPISYSMLLDSARDFAVRLRRANLHPSLFEIMTILALVLFREAGCDIAILETGIGGRLDATNYIDHPACCAITAISLDHTQLLGDTPEAIAAEKAGIIKSAIPVVIGAQPYPAALEMLRSRARDLGAPVHGPADDERLNPFLPSALPPFIRENARTALAVCDVLGLRPDAGTFQLPAFPARCEVIRRAPLVVLDAAHNADSARRLVESVNSLFPGTRFSVILGVVKGKDVAGIVREIKALDADFILTNPATAKGSDLDLLVAEARKQGLAFRVIPDLHAVKQLPAGANLLFTGSFFTAVIGERLFNP